MKKALSRSLVSFVPVVVWLLGTSCSKRDYEPEPTREFPRDVDASACVGTRCSRDLHQVIDACTGSVLETCPPDQGCGANGKCMTACDAVRDVQGSLGCDFVALPPDSAADGSNGSCFAAFVGNTWDQPVSVRVEYDGRELDTTGHVYIPELDGGKLAYRVLDEPLPPGKVAILFMAQAAKPSVPGDGSHSFTACPPAVQPLLSIDPIEHGTALTKSFRIRSDRPVSAYSIWPYGGALSYVSSATLLLPTSSLGSNYMLMNGWEYSSLGKGTPGAQLVATEDGTEVKLTPVVNLADGKGVKGSAAGETATYSLNKGQVLQFSSFQEFNGSPVEANKPIAVFGGASCMNIPITEYACDAASQQFAAVNQWGNEYVGVRYRSRLGEAAENAEVVPWRIMAAVNDTVLSFDPEPPPGAAEKLASGEATMFWTSRPFTVRSQDSDHPIFMSAYMTSGGPYGANGDPEFVNVVPTGQYLDHYVFYADVTYAETSLTFVRQKAELGFQDVTLDCAGVLGDWKPVGNDGAFEFTRVDLSRGFAPVTVNGNQCHIGPHEAKSDGPFTVTVWGWDASVSYAYPAGMGSRPLSKVVVPVK
jgi:IgGFc binding protein